MSDFDNEDDIFRKLQAEEDEVKPIDIGIGKPMPSFPIKGGIPPFETSDMARAPEPASIIHSEEIPADIAAKMAHTEFKLIQKGDYMDLLRKDPTLKRIRIGAGWEQRMLEEERVDIDLSAFALNIMEQTRVDEDFIFYNNDSGVEGGVKFLGDSRTGAGEGDDEAMTIDLNAIPFDVTKIMFVLSIYDEELKGHNFSMVRDVFLRVVNDDDQNEICRFIFKGEDDLKGGNAIYVAMLLREGPKWYFEVKAEVINGGLAEIATKYGIIVREIQSSG
jgi:tellurium resistance protein TerD